ncbi:MAG: preprotein translocase subunit SecG [Selenomonadaceae bacterium]|nr:preprotein translocase subunit SecG [Selenomonadaceae bacterium]
MMTVLMILDAIISIALIAVILGQEAKSGGMGGMDGGSDAVFSGKARGIDALLARLTIILGVLFGIITLIIAKLSM